MIKRLLLVLLVAAAVSGVASPGAEAGRECDGLLVCIPVAGPWVQVNGGRDADLLPALAARAAAR